MTGPPAAGAPGPAPRLGLARARAQALLDAWQEYGAELRFVQNATGTRVHVLSEPNTPAWAREDPPQRRPTIDEITETVTGAVPAVCGVRVRCHRGGMEQGGRRVDDFPDELLCRRCHAGFTPLGDAAAALIFEHNRRPYDEFSRNTDPAGEEAQRHRPAISTARARSRARSPSSHASRAARRMNNGSQLPPGRAGAAQGRTARPGRYGHIRRD